MIILNTIFNMSAILTALLAAYSGYLAYSMMEKKYKAVVTDFWRKAIFFSFSWALIHMLLLVSWWVKQGLNDIGATYDNLWLTYHNGSALLQVVVHTGIVRQMKIIQNYNKEIERLQQGMAAHNKALKC